MQAQMLEGMNQFFVQFAGNQAAVDSGARPRPEAVYERFRRMSPKKFSGTTDPMVAEGCIKSIEVIFDFMELADADRVRCATFLLTGDASLWWESVSVSVNLQTLTWDSFKEVFYSKHFTEEVHSHLTREFMSLRQEDNSMADIVKKFESGCYFVPLIANDARDKLRHFMDGLRPILRRDVRVASPTTYAVVVSRALAVEHEQRDIEIDRQGKRPYQAPPHQHQQHQRPQPKRPYQGPPGKKPYQGPPKGKGPMPQQKAPQRPGNIFIKRVSAKALIDSGATHLFISKSFASHLDVESIGLDVNYSVTIPSGEELSDTNVIRDIDLELHDHLVYADLIVWPMPEFNIILGMDWLKKNRVLIDF
ncbi:uncharacterized protein [Primulina eburnea]|uniref:uncharacterized protein n=1 Tax=Primulina eburnea TaxID=1245227 RepID=UPI003C6C1D7A